VVNSAAFRGGAGELVELAGTRNPSWLECHDLLLGWFRLTNSAALIISRQIVFD
jgi:hypothetical protein